MKGPAIPLLLIWLTILCGTGCDTVVGPSLGSPDISLVTPEGDLVQTHSELVHTDSEEYSPIQIPISAQITSTVGINEVICKFEESVLPLVSQSGSLYTWEPFIVEFLENHSHGYTIIITAEDFNGEISTLTIFMVIPHAPL